MDPNLINDGLSALSQFRTAGWLAGLLALVGVLVRVSKTPFVEKLLSVRPWARPAVAGGLGALLGAVTALGQGKGTAGALAGGVSGLIAGLAATGAHQALGGLTSDGRAESDARAAVASVVHAGDDQVTANVEALTRTLATVAALPDASARMRALAKFANEHPPAGAGTSAGAGAGA